MKAWFPTLIYSERLLPRGIATLNRELLSDAGRIREQDVAGQRWSDVNYPLGYTSYGSLDQLHRLSSTFDTLRGHIDAHVRRYARALDWDLRGGRLQMSDCWLNVMPQGCAHSFHLHPHAVISGTYYVRTPRGCAGLRFEDPRLSRMMAAPARKGRRPEQAAHVLYPARAGQVVLFESWLRHEVPPSRSGQDRVSISFNYDWR